MGRPRVYQTDNERKRAHDDRQRLLVGEEMYREERLLKQQALRTFRKEESGGRDPVRVRERERRQEERQEQRHRALSTRHFISIDGETFNGKYQLLQASNGEMITRYGSELSTLDCFEFLFRLAERDEGWLVGFGLNLDVNYWLRDLSYRELMNLAKTGEGWFETDRGWKYQISYVERKFLRLRKHFADGSKCRTVEVYDTVSFFNDGFANVMESWKVGLGDLPFIRQMKEDRSRLADFDRATVERYNGLEVTYHAEVMNKLRDMCVENGIYLSRWYGPALITKFWFKERGVLSLIQEKFPNDEVLRACLEAYFGGWIQCFRPGRHGQTCLGDINSAYPFAMLSCPSMDGEWTWVDRYDEDEPFAIWDVAWRWELGRVIYPLPWRSKSGAIYYPETGRGRYHAVLINEVLRWREFSKGIRILGGWVFRPHSDERPFEWVAEMMATRLRYKAEGNPAEYPLKIGANSAYGVLAQGELTQKVKDPKSGRWKWEKRTPKTRNYFLAGFITASCRAQILRAYMESNVEPIAIATDGAFSDRPLKVNYSKQLGEWGAAVYGSSFIPQPGFYACHDGRDLDGTPLKKEKDREKRMSRSFRPSEVANLWPELESMWDMQGDRGRVMIDQTNFIGFRLALAQKRRYGLKRWREWVTVPKPLAFHPGKGYQSPNVWMTCPMNEPTNYASYPYRSNGKRWDLEEFDRWARRDADCDDNEP